MKHYSTLDCLSNEVLFANYYQHFLKKSEKVSEVPLILRQILNYICVNKQPNDSTIFSYTQFIVYSHTQIIVQSKLMYGYKVEGPISFKSFESVADSHQFKTMPRLFIKKLFYSTTFLSVLAFFYGTSLLQIISKNNQTSLRQSSNSLLNSFQSEKLIDWIAKFQINKLKIGF